MIVSREQMRESGAPRTASVPVPELGEGAEVVVQGYSVGSRLKVLEFAMQYGQDGRARHNPQNDRLMSFILALKEPQLTVADCEWVLALSDGIVDRVIAKALELSGVSTYEQLKSGLRANPYVRRIYNLCVGKLGRLPSELDNITELEFLTALAAVELDDEDMQAATDAAATGAAR